MTAMGWLLRAAWGDLRGHRGHVIRRRDFWEPDFAWCETCRNVVLAKRLK